MKILNICAYTWEIGGPARIIYDHTTEALRQGHQVAILSPMSPGDKLYPVPEGATLIPCLRTPVISRIYREFSLELYGYLKKHIREYDIVHIHGIWHFGSLAPFLIPNKVPRVITIHGLLDRWAIRHSGWKKSLVSALYQKRLLRKTDLIQVNNSEEEEDVTLYLGAPPRNLKIIPNGMRLDDYSSLPERGLFLKHFHLQDTGKTILFMGRLNRKKGLDLLLPAFEKYHQQHPDARLILAGPDDGYEAATRAFLEAHNLTEAVKLVGMLTGELKMKALADAAVFVLPTYSEGFSIAVLEAMAAGVPVIVSDRTGFGDYTREYEAAALTELNAANLTENLEKVLGDESYRRTIAANALRMVTGLFDIRVVANTLLEEYKKLGTVH